MQKLELVSKKTPEISMIGPQRLFRFHRERLYREDRSFEALDCRREVNALEAEGTAWLVAPSESLSDSSSRTTRLIRCLSNRSITNRRTGRR